MATPTQGETKAKLQDLERSLAVGGESVVKASDALKECFISAESSSEHFVVVRHRFTNQAIVFKDVHLKLSLKVVHDITDVFNNFKVVRFEVFEQTDIFKGFLHKLERYGRHSGTLAQLYKAFLVDVTDTEAEAKRAVQALQLDATHYAQTAQAAAKQAAEAENAAVAAGLCGLACLFCGPAAVAGAAAAGAASLGAGMAADSERYSARALAAQEEQRVAEIAGKVILEQLLPSITRFMEAVSAFHAFFIYLEARLKRHYVSLADRATLALEFHVLQAGAADLLKECSMFIFAASQASSALEWVQVEASSRRLVDGTYVQRWLNDKQQELNLQPTFLHELLNLAQVMGGNGALPATVPPGQSQ